MKTTAAMFGKKLLPFAMLVCLVLAGADAARCAGHRFEKTGWMTALDKDGSVEIDGKGYGLDPAVLAEDARGRYVLPAQLALPAFIHFQFVYTARGPIIVRLKVDPHVRQ
jgi:hypothetical protein